MDDDSSVDSFAFDYDENHKRTDTSSNLVFAGNARVTKNTSQEIQHAKCIENLEYFKFEWFSGQIKEWHKSNLSQVFEDLKSEREK